MVSFFDWQFDIYERLDMGFFNMLVFLEGVLENMDIVKDFLGFYKLSLILWFGQVFDFFGFGGCILVFDFCGIFGEDKGVMKQVGFIVEFVVFFGLFLFQFLQVV